MLKLIKIKKLIENLEISCTYSPSVQTYNLTTRFMTDESKPIQLAGGGCIWLAADGAIGEIEFIFPKIVQKPNEIRANQYVIGIPAFELTTPKYDNSFIQVLEEGIIIWLNEQAEIELSIRSEHIEFLISNNQLCGVLIKDVTIIL